MLKKRRKVEDKAKDKATPSTYLQKRTKAPDHELIYLSTTEVDKGSKPKLRYRVF